MYIEVKAMGIEVCEKTDKIVEWEFNGSDLF